jgi:hypothetical protein
LHSRNREQNNHQYDRQSPIGMLDKALDEAIAKLGR